jgi:hypothetical protein
MISSSPYVSNSIPISELSELTAVTYRESLIPFDIVICQYTKKCPFSYTIFFIFEQFQLPLIVDNRILLNELRETDRNLLFIGENEK